MNHTRERNKWLVFFLVAVGVFMSTLDGSIVNIALPTIMADFAAPLDIIGWVLMIYLLTVSSFLLSFGRLSDIWGRRWVYSRGLLIFSSGSLLCGTAGNIWWLIAARGFQGIGAAMIMSCTPALIADAFPIKERGKALGMNGAVVASGLTVGPALGGIIIHQFSWQMIFFINIPIGLAASLAVSILLKDTKADTCRKESFDLPGAVLLAVVLSCLLIALSNAYEWGYTSTRTLILLGAALVSVLGLIRIEPKTHHPIVEPSLLRIRLFVLPAASAMILFMSLFTMIFLMPFFLMHPCGFSVNHAGYIMMTPFMFLFLVTPISGTLSDKIGSRMLCTIGMGIMTTAIVFLSLLEPSSDSLDIAWRMGLAGIGTAVFISPNTSITMSAVPKNYMGVAAGTVASARNLGMVIGIAVAGTIFNTVFFRMSGVTLKVYTPELENVFMTAFRYAMISGSITAGIGMIVAFLRGKDGPRIASNYENPLAGSDI